MVEMLKVVSVAEDKETVPVTHLEFQYQSQACNVDN